MIPNHFSILVYFVIIISKSGCSKSFTTYAHIKCKKIYYVFFNHILVVLVYNMNYRCVITYRLYYLYQKYNCANLETIQY